MAWKSKKPPTAPDTSGKAEPRRVVDRRQRSGRDGARLEALRRVPSLDALQPATRRAVELWAEGHNPNRIAEATGIPPLHLAALSDSPAAQAYYTQVRAERDAARVDLAAVVPWVELWQALRRTKPR